jgi:hypothetical protein
MSKTPAHILLRVCVASVLVCSTFSQSSYADQNGTVQSTTTGSDYEYRFKDEDLLGNTLANTGDIFRGRAGFHRVLLLRPRTAFIPQLFKSVENL